MRELGICTGEAFGFAFFWVIVLTVSGNFVFSLGLIANFPP
jgi:hypothetical protein